MHVNIGAVLVGAATNPYKTGYFQGNALGFALAPLEAVTACSGMFGVGAYPGDLLVDKSSKASYNLYGVNGRKFLLPYRISTASPARLLVDDTAVASKICADEAIELWLKWVHGSLHFLEGKVCVRNLEIIQQELLNQGLKLGSLVSHSQGERNNFMKNKAISKTK